MQLMSRVSTLILLLLVSKRRKKALELEQMSPKRHNKISHFLRVEKLDTRGRVTNGGEEYKDFKMVLFSSPFPEDIGTTLVLVLTLTLQFQIIRDKWNFLHQSKTEQRTNLVLSKNSTHIVSI